ncbi:hypothetical protein CE91St43_26290 [Oscillospiraceae bacterium]|nr:hypothetical protein CE91St43_26290 [Oscillospiraceae bacterium]
MDVSQNQTECFGLHLWEPGDNFLREEFNENFEKLDDAARVMSGVYIGDGQASQFISLGFQPMAVLVEQSNGTRPAGSNYTLNGGLALTGHPVQKSAGWPVIAVEFGGFRVYRYDGYAGDNNSNGQIYHFLAYR